MNNKLYYNIKRLFSLLGKHKLRYFVGITLCAIIVPAFDLVFPLSMSYIIDAASQKDYVLLMRGLKLIMAMFGIYAIGIPISAYIYEGSCRKPHYEIRISILKHLMCMPYKKIMRQQSGELLTKMNEDLDVLLRFYKDQTYNIISTVFLGIGSLILVFYFSTKIAIVLLIIGLITVFVRKYKTNELKEESNELRNYIGESNNIISNSLSSIKVIKSFSSHKYFMSKLDGNIDQMVKSTKLIGNLKIKKYSADFVLEILNFAFVLSFGTYLVSSNELSIGNMLAIVAMYSSVVKMFGDIGNYIFGIKVIMVQATKIFDLLDIDIENADKSFSKDKNIQTSALISLRNIKFSYDDHQTVLDGLNLDVEDERLIVLTGESGIGKSTILKIMCGLMECDEGSIYINGEITNLNMLRDNISYVPQHPYLFNASILDNIKMLNSDASIDEVERVARIACVDEFIYDKEDGFDTMVGESGNTLSGGQIQRIAIARALLKKSLIIVIDEGTSAIDSAIEKKIMDNLLEACNDKTIIFAAHRKTIEDNAGRIIKFEELIS